MYPRWLLVLGGVWVLLCVLCIGVEGAGVKEEVEELREVVKRLKGEVDVLERVIEKHLEVLGDVEGRGGGVKDGGGEGGGEEGSEEGEAGDCFVSGLKIHFHEGIDYVGGPQRLYYLPNFASPSETSHILREATPRLQKSEVMGYTASDGVGDALDARTRSSESAYFESDEEVEDVVVSRLISRLHVAAAMPRSFGENLQLTRYPLGTNYTFHFDSSLQVGRLATTLVFLNTVSEGGETIFPRAKWTERGLRKLALIQAGRAMEVVREDGLVVDAWGMTEDGVEGVVESQSLPTLLQSQSNTSTSSSTSSSPPLPPLPSSARAALETPMEPFCQHPHVVKFPPRRGDALLWFNHDTELRVDQNTLHGGCTPTSEEKFIAQRWMRFYPADKGNRYAKLIEKCRRK